MIEGIEVARGEKALKLLGLPSAGDSIENDGSRAMSIRAICGARSKLDWFEAIFPTCRELIPHKTGQDV